MTVRAATSFARLPYLPLHGGHVPAWLAERMTKLGTAIIESVVLAASGDWASGFARRYHWHSASVRDFVEGPHTGIVGELLGMNLVGAQAKPAQNALLAIAHENPEVTLGQILHLAMPRHHDVRAARRKAWAADSPDLGDGRRADFRGVLEHELAEQQMSLF